MVGERGGLVALLAVTLSVVCLRPVVDVEAADELDDVARSHLVARNDSEANEILNLKESEETHPHDLSDKPSKFDRDVSPLIYTDRKYLLKNETQRLENSSTSVEDGFIGQRRDDKVSRNTTIGKAEKLSRCKNRMSFACLELELDHIIDDLSKLESYNFTQFMQIVRKQNTTRRDGGLVPRKESTSLIDKVHRYAMEHVLKIRLPSDLIASGEARTFFGAIFQGKSSFLTGFGLGFLAFGLKKLLLPLFIGAQIVKSVLIALFLPSIIGSIGKIVGKGLTSFAQNSQSANAPSEENFEFKDNLDPYNDDYVTRQPLGTLPASAMYGDGMGPQKAEMASRYGLGIDSRIGSPAYALSDRYYSRHAISQGFVKKQDYKVFHEIPTSSLLLTNYDPFYSPLLSRLDAVFSRLGHTTEGCREYAVCAMYRSPARYAPYSNLVSAQLSRELNELRKPSSDNPDVLRFFRYMRAAKDGQDGLRCEEVYRDCMVAREDGTEGQNQAILATYQDIDKLVHARKL